MNRHSSKMFIVSESGSVRETDICEADIRETDICEADIVREAGIGRKASRGELIAVHSISTFILTTGHYAAYQDFQSLKR